MVDFSSFRNPRFVQDEQARLARIRGLENLSNPNFFQQIQLSNEKNTAANLRSQSYKEGSALLEEGQLYQKMRALEEAEALRPKRQELERLKIQSDIEKFKLGSPRGGAGTGGLGAGGGAGVGAPSGMGPTTTQPFSQMAMPPQMAPQPLGSSLAAFGGRQNELQRAYSFGRDEEELGRLRMAAEARKLQGQMAFQPQMEAIRGKVMRGMAGRMGTMLPQSQQPYSSGTGYTPSWSPNYQPPRFPNFY